MMQSLHEDQLKSSGLAGQVRSVASQVWEIDVHFARELPSDGKIRIGFAQPLADIAGCWRPSGGPDRNLPISWERERNRQDSSAGLWAPVKSLLSLGDRNRGTVALSIADERMEIHGGVVEDQGNIWWSIVPGEAVVAAKRSFRIRLDGRDLPVAEALRAVVDWWAQPDVVGPTAPVAKDSGRVPLYSTWYAYRQSIHPEAVAEEVAQARQIGLGGIIVDDGWQMPERIYNNMAWTGTWTPDRFGGTERMREQIAAIRADGFAYLIWIGLPFLGIDDPQLPDFTARGWILARQDRISAAVVDPRFPEVRHWLLDHVERLVESLGIDGLKIDFIDRFTEVWDGVLRTDGGRDIASVDGAVALLIAGIAERLQGRWPGLPIEFRQRYIGPVVRQAGNLLRAMDCPNDHVENRRRIVDTRLLAGDAVTHADMVFWHPEDPVESAALQIISVLPAVPQISVRLASLSPEHREMLTFWIGFWKRYRSVLLDGNFEPSGHLASWNRLECANQGTRIVILFDPQWVEWGSEAATEKLIVINATRGPEIVLDAAADAGVTYAIQDCRGRTVGEGAIPPRSGFQKLAVPPSGVIEVTRTLA